MKLALASASGARAGHAPRRRHLVFTALLGVLGLASLLLAACGTGDAPGPQLAANQTLVWPYEDITTGVPNLLTDEVLDPATITSLEDASTADMLYTNLVTFDSNLRVVPDAAASMPTVNAQHTVYTFHLRPNLRFSDGTPITASDFAYGIDRALDPHLCDTQDAKTYNPSGLCYAGFALTYLGHITGANRRESGALSSDIGQGASSSLGLDVIDPLTLQIRLSSPVAFFLDALTYNTSAPLEKSFLAKWPGGQWVFHLDQGGCSGPFKVASYSGGKQMTLVPNPYWEQAFGQNLTLTSVVRPAVSSQEQEYANYRAGQYSITGVPPDDYSFAYGQPDFHEVPSLATDYIGVNTGMAPFDSLALRQAFDLALNKQLIVDRIENGGAIPTNHIVPLGMAGYDAGLKNPPPDNTQSITGNQSAAAQLFQSVRTTCATPGPNGQPAHDWCPYMTGSSPQPITINVEGSNATRMAIAKSAIAQWQSVFSYQSGGQTVSLNIKINPVAFDSLLANMNWGQSAMQLWIIGWVADYPDPQDFLTNQFLPSNALNASNLNDPTLSKLMVAADEEQNPTTRMQMYNQAEQRAVDDVPWIPYQQDKWFWRMRTTVHGFAYDPFGLMEGIRWPDVYITQQ